MKRILSLFAVLLFFPGLKSFAGSDLGGEISYQYLSANSYQVKFTRYLDCQVALVPSTINLNIKSPGCFKGQGRSITLNQVSRKTGKPYGAASPAFCNGAVNPLFEIVTYSGTLNFSATETLCRDWALSVSTTDRTEAENITASPNNVNFYTEAYLKLNPNLTNNSPVFDTLNSQLMYVNYYTDYKLSIAAKDPDGDSLAYSLVAPLTAANSPVAYAPSFIPGAGPFGNYIVNPKPKPPYNNPFAPQLAIMPANFPANFSANNPMPSIQVDWNGAPTIPLPNAPFQPMIWEVNPYIIINRASGEIKFNPIYYSTQKLPGKNKFLVSILVEEFRKINGITTKIGSVRRETLFQVFEYNSNLDPVIAPVSPNQPAQLRFSTATGTNGLVSGISELRAFPNPFKDELTFNLNLQTKAESIIIYNLLGQQVDEIPLKTLGLGEQKVQWQNAGKHAAGTYVAKLISLEKTIQTLKFTKIQ